MMHDKTLSTYTFLASLVIAGLAGSLITAPKVVHFGLNFPFSNIVFSLLTYPIIDCICELWGKDLARKTMWLGLASQLFLALIIQLSIMAPHPSFWQLQTNYQAVLGTSIKVVIASVLAFSISQLIDIGIYQKIKQLSQGKLLWLRSNLSTYLGQALDSFIFIMIVFTHSPQKLTILVGSISIKIILSLLMTPFVYLIVIGIDRYLDEDTLAFKNKTEMEKLSSSRL